MTKKRATKIVERAALPYDIGKIINDFVIRNCMPLYTCDFRENDDRTPYCDSEIRIVLHGDGKGYVHVIGRDSETINFDLDSFEARKQFSKPLYWPDLGLERINTALEHLRNVVRKEMDSHQKSK